MPDAIDDNLLENISPAQWEYLSKMIETKEFREFDFGLFCQSQESSIFTSELESPITTAPNSNDAESPGSQNLTVEDFSVSSAGNGTPLATVGENTIPLNDIGYSDLFSLGFVGNPINSSNIFPDEIVCGENSDERLKIIAEPKAFYRERYGSETAREKNRAQRFIRTEDANKTYEYPTVRIPEIWRNRWKPLYIRVSLVTVMTDHNPNTCVHPYPIDTSERDVIKDSVQNSLYFRVTVDEIRQGEKNFRITRKKLVQSELRNHGKLRLFDSNDFDVFPNANLQDPKKMIEFYELWKSQLVFTLAELQDQQHYPTPFHSTTAVSQITIDVASEGRKTPNKFVDFPPELSIRCVPQRALWSGDEPVVLIFPNPIKQRIYEISVEFGSLTTIIVPEYNLVDKKTLLFQIPACPFLMTDENFRSTIVVKEDRTVLTRIPFEYLSLNRNQICSNCLMGENVPNRAKRRLIESERLIGYSSNDGGESLIDQMSRLNIEIKTTKSSSAKSDKNPTEISSPTKIQEKDSDWKIDKYLNQLKESIADFVRTDNPSSIFRRTRVLLSKCDEPLPLHVAIEKGHNRIGQILTEQVIDMNTANGLLNQTNSNGQTPFLLAAEFDRWSILKIILEKRLDLVQKTDQNLNNFLHLLAQKRNFETIQKSLQILPKDVKYALLEAQNKNYQTPEDIAKLFEDDALQNILHVPENFK